ncbi:MAG TPA: hypothetical protein DCO82_07660 [Alphaproteobacteria bacterium]|jgi:phenylpropionate dioxygenase-like ring-hydroxylating dioxygenase large terminal subunit|nr:hypothetical protein [Alphaproteobacteria bacterium]
MLKAQQIEISERLLRYKETNTQAMADAPFVNPVSIYTDPAHFARERELFFRQIPLFMGLSSRLAKPGDFITNNFTGQPILIMRGEKGELNAFLNVCRHRGARVLEEECGRGKRRFTCPYHGWVYDTSGKLAEIPHSERVGALDKAALGLTRLPAAEKYGLIFVRPTPGAPVDVDALLGGLGPEIGAFGFEKYAHYRSASMSYNFNWKIVQDTFLETYHLPVLHRTTVNPLIDWSVSTFDPYDYNLRFAITRKDFEQWRDQPPAERNVLSQLAIVYLLFPNLTFIWQGDHAEAWCAYPDANHIDRTNIEFMLFAPEPPANDSVRRHWDRNFDIAIATVEKEDFPMSEKLNAGFFSGAQKEVVYGRNEPALIHYHESLRRAMRANKPIF